MVDLTNTTKIQHSYTTAKEPHVDQLKPIMCHFQEGRTQKTLDEVRLLLKLFPNSAILHNLYGVASKALGNLDIAVEFYKKAIILNPNYISVNYNMGIVLKEQGKLYEALDCYEKELSLNPRDPRPYNNIGIIFEEQGKFKEATISYNKALAIKPDYAAVHNNLGIVFRNQGKLKKALLAYDKSLSLDPNNANALNNKASILLRLARPDEAIEYLNKSLKINPMLVDTHFNMGLAFQDLGNLKDSIRSYEKAISLEPTHVKSIMNLSAVKNRSIPAWHLPMMNDACRNTAYLNAIKLAINEGDFVLEIGTGSGLLAMMAADSGAKQIITCESSESIATVAEKIILENGFSDIVTVINKKSTELIVGTDLPQKADVIISEVLSAEFVGEGVLSTILDANKRLIRKAGKMLPESGDIKVALLGNSEEVSKNVLVGNVHGFNLSKFNSVMTNKFSLRLKKPPNLLSNAEKAFTFNLQNSDRLTTKEKVFDLTVTKTGICVGIIQWLGIQIFKDIEYENRPGEVESHWPTPIYLFDKPLEVISGQALQIRGTLFEDSVWFQLLD